MAVSTIDPVDLQLDLCLDSRTGSKRLDRGKPLRRDPPARAADRAPRRQVALGPHPPAFAAQRPADPVGQRERHRIGQPAVAIALQLHALTRAPARAARPAGTPASCGSRRSPRPRRRSPGTALHHRHLRPGPQVHQLLALARFGQHRLAAGHEPAPVARRHQQLALRPAPPSSPRSPPRPPGRSSAAPARRTRARRASLSPPSV